MTLGKEPGSLQLAVLYLLNPARYGSRYCTRSRSDGVAYCK